MGHPVLSSKFPSMMTFVGYLESRQSAVEAENSELRVADQVKWGRSMAEVRNAPSIKAQHSLPN